MYSTTQIAVDILLAFLTGGILLFFLEVMHLEGEVSRDFKSIMNPFYYKLSRFMVFLNHYNYAVVFPKDNKACAEFKNLIEHITKRGLECIMTGRDMSYLSAKELDSLCESINHIWFSLDRYTEVKREISINISYRYDEAIEAISEVFPCYKGSEADIALLYKASGEFYSYVWEPVQHCTWNYEFYLEEEKITRVIVLLTLLEIGLSLMCIMVWVDSMHKFIPCIMVLVSFILLTGCLIQLSKLSSISKRISRSTYSEMKQSYFSVGDFYRKVAHRFSSRQGADKD